MKCYEIFYQIRDDVCRFSQYKLRSSDEMKFLKIFTSVFAYI